MNQKIKDKIADAVYFFYRHKILKNRIRVYSVDETIEQLLTTKKSLVRFGDGEITMIRGRSLQLQNTDSMLIEDLKRILQYDYEDLMVAVPDIFDGVEQYQEKSRQFWKDHLLFSRRVYEKYCRKELKYGNAFISRCYQMWTDKKKSEEWFSKIRNIWAGQDIVVVEGSRSHSGVGNDLFYMAASVERIIGPARNAYAKLDELEAACLKYPKDRLFLVALGAAAKPLTERLFLKGYRVIDIGNLDMEYEWFLRKAETKAKLEKHTLETEEENQKAGYGKYLEQICVKIEEKEFVSDKVGGVVLNYNNYQETIKCVDSLLKQEKVDLEIVIVDNGSENESARVLREKYGKIKQCHIIESKENLGYAAGNNLGISFLRRRNIKFIWVLNSDIIFTKSDILRECMRAYQPGVGLINATSFKPDGTKNYRISYRKKLLLLRLGKHFAMEEIHYLCRKKKTKKESGNVKANFDIGKYNSKYSFDYLVNEDQYIVTGSVFLLTKDFFEFYGGLFPRTFLYGEEYATILLLHKAGLKTETVETGAIIHKHKASTPSELSKNYLIESIRKIVALFFMDSWKIRKKYFPET